MRLSQSEHNIKQSLEQREITPSKSLWDNIQQELDNQDKPKKKYIWYRVASIAAVLCLAFLAYQGLTRTDSPAENYVIESQPIITAPVNLDAEILTTRVAKEPVINASLIEPADAASTEVASVRKEKTAPVDKQNTLDGNEVEELLAIAEAQALAETNNIQLEDEVNALLASVTNQKTTKEQKQILNTISAELLLAEVEGEIDPKKSIKFKDKVWGVLVANFNDMKQDLAFN